MGPTPSSSLLPTLTTRRVQRRLLINDRPREQHPDEPAVAARGGANLDLSPSELGRVQRTLRVRKLTELKAKGQTLEVYRLKPAPKPSTWNSTSARISPGSR